jgi:hypothetical protein
MRKRKQVMQELPAANYDHANTYVMKISTTFCIRCELAVCAVRGLS